MLYVVGTPIGNLSDVTYRAIEVLNSVDYIACEDTRTSRVFLEHYNISKPLVAYHKYNEKSMLPKIIKDLELGKNIALISDAGMPGISDPGSVLINELIKLNMEYTVISGPSAFLNAFILSGYKTPFTFIGFLPEKKSERKKLLQEVKEYFSTLIFYVAPHDLSDTIQELLLAFGERNICVVRELTKKFEQVSHTTLSKGYDGVLKGEFVLVVEGTHEKDNADLNLSVAEHLVACINNGCSKDEAIKQVAKLRNLKKNDVYQEYIKLDINKK